MCLESSGVLLKPSPPFAFHLHPSPPPPLGPPEGSPCLATSPLPHSHFSLRTATWSELPQMFPQYLLSPVHLRNQSSLWKLIPDVVTPNFSFFFLSFFYYVFILSSRAAPEAYEDSQARGRIRATAAALWHSHSHVGSKPCL